MLKNYLKDPLSAIAINTTIFISGCLFFGCLAVFGIVSEIIRDGKNLPKDLREGHNKQHVDEQVKYDQMIQLLDSIKHKLALITVRSKPLILL